ncbi:SprT-like domain-containing protein [Methylibium petroleiphilum]|uniref:Zinc metalloproteinase Mpr protein n=1 Tax=Methylibium petroleiphilum (strain ATCC BAA-1232 / LMG 22953 / PM1) TaxID=420662 RepID=A2SNI1_METPP|nr:SprT-like domain-containing protein [Methylibium petroleiphilum]ABM97120.1 zinc metalloproteinase Mpr protein [Methylibium petroleiphilum PM1]
MKSERAALRATQECYEELQRAYDFFNERLFDNELPGALITMQRTGRSLGHYSSARYVDRSGAKADEINMNPGYFATRPIEDTLSTLGHEMTHQWREHGGNPPRRCYHDKEWAAKMKQIGLHPSSTGRPGGKEVGEKMSHYVLADGLFIQACKELLRTSFGIVWFDRFPMACPKDFDYANGVTVSVPSKPGAQTDGPKQDAASLEHDDAATDQEEGASDGGGETDGADGQVVKVPMLSAPPIDAGLDVAMVESAEERAGGAPAGAATKANASNRLKYTCPGCKTNIWAKPNINVDCGDCSARFTAGA